MVSEDLFYFPLRKVHFETKQGAPITCKIKIQTKISLNDNIG